MITDYQRWISIAELSIITAALSAGITLGWYTYYQRRLAALAWPPGSLRQFRRLCKNYLGRHGWEEVPVPGTYLDLMVRKDRREAYIRLRPSGFSVTGQFLTDMSQIKMRMRWSPVLVIVYDAVSDLQRQEAHQLGLRLVHFAELRDLAPGRALLDTPADPVAVA